jgi:PAS domain S-box-containing protein
MANDLERTYRSYDAGGLIDALPCGVLTFDDSGRVLYVNATLRSMLGYDAGELDGIHVERLLTVAGRIFYQTHFFPLLRLHGAAREVFLLLRTKSGTDIGALVNATRNTRNGAAAIDCVLMEVHERRKYEEELLRARQSADKANAQLKAEAKAREEALARVREQAVELEAQSQQLQEQAAELELQQDELQLAYDRLLGQTEELERARTSANAANEAKSQFLSTMSHELRTPLNAIGGYVQLMEMEVQGPITDAQRQSLDRIMRSHRHLLRLVNDVLDLSRIEAGRMEYRIEEIDLPAMVSSVVPMVEPQLAQAGLTLDTAIDAAASARADREKMQQILINLLTNAVKFTPPGGRVAVRTRRAADEGSVYVDVSDTGIGIPADKLVSVFEPFVQVKSEHSRRAEGTGLGLAISRDLARGMGGDLTASSEPGAGSTFTLRLPPA